MFKDKAAYQIIGQTVIRPMQKIISQPSQSEVRFSYPLIDMPNLNTSDTLNLVTLQVSDDSNMSKAPAIVPLKKQKFRDAKITEEEKQLDNSGKLANQKSLSKNKALRRITQTKILQSSKFEYQSSFPSIDKSSNSSDELLSNTQNSTGQSMQQISQSSRCDLGFSFSSIDLPSTSSSTMLSNKQNSLAPHISDVSDLSKAPVTIPQKRKFKDNTISKEKAKQLDNMVNTSEKLANKKSMPQNKQLRSTTQKKISQASQSEFQSSFSPFDLPSTSSDTVVSNTKNSVVPQISDDSDSPQSPAIVPLRKRKFKENTITVEKAKQLDNMVNTGEKPTNKTTTSQNKQRRRITQDNCTIFDVFLEVRAHRTETQICKNLLMEALNLNTDQDLESLASTFPFTLPLSNAADVENCEKYIENQENFKNLVCYLSRELKKQNTKDPSTAVGLLLHDEIFDVYGWSARHNKKTGRKNASPLKVFTSFLNDYLRIKNVKAFIAKYANLARRRIRRTHANSEEDESLLSSE